MNILKDCISSLINTLNKPWFSRAWIIQESALSRSLTIILDTTEFELGSLYRLLIVVTSIETRLSTKNMHKSQVLRSRGAQTLSHIRTCRVQLQKAAPERLPFIDILRRLAIAFDASDARDQVYAFLAFQSPDEKWKIVPDYKLETSDAYTIISASIAQSTNSLSILGIVPGGEYPGRLPSWVIDWRLNKTTQGTPFDRDGKTDFNASFRYRYRAVVDPSPTLKCIRVRGKVVGRVTGVSEVTHDATLSVPQAWKLEEVVESLVSQSTSFSETPLRKRVLVVLMAQDTNLFKSGLDRESVLEEMLRVYQNYERIVNKDTTLDNFSRLNTVADKLTRNAGLCTNKKVFCSEDSRIGFGPRLVNIDDSVFILHGSRVPVILRRQRKGYSVVGQCYYEDWMYGDLVDWKEDEGDSFDLI